MEAKWLRLPYEFSGLFYRKAKCRRALDIREIGCQLEKPDLIVIMMNPGSSYPINKGKEPFKIEQAVFQPTYPDTTQWQVIEFMRAECLKKVSKKKIYKYARVLNLSDLCNPRSEKLNKDEIEGNSIFQLDQKAVLNVWVEQSADILLAYGANRKFEGLANKALHFLKDNGKTKVYGYRKKEDSWEFYHPLMHSNKNNKRWVDEVRQVTLKTVSSLNGPNT